MPKLLEFANGIYSNLKKKNCVRNDWKLNVDQSDLHVDKTNSRGYRKSSTVCGGSALRFERVERVGVKIFEYFKDFWVDLSPRVFQIAWE